MTQDYAATFAYVSALAGDPNSAVLDFRAIHDANKEIPALPRRGTLPELWQELCTWNNQGYGIFCCINAMDGQGRELANVAYCRAHAVDLDNLSAPQNYARAAGWTPQPSFAVQSSPNKFHVYWTVEPYTGNDFYQLQQRKLRQLFDGDRTIIDPTRVLRVPGFYHCKPDNVNGPHLVSCWALNGYGRQIPVAELAEALAGVNVIDGGHGERRELGEPSLAAPSIGWLQRALDLLDPNRMDRGEWISFTASFKQAAWTTAGADLAFDMWSKWCERYAENDAGENLKQWNSIRNTELGWPTIARRPEIMFKPADNSTAYVTGQPAPSAPPPVNGHPVLPHGDVPPMPVNEPPPLDCSGEMLTHIEQQEWFKGCIFVERFGEIFTPSGRLMNATKFNGTYGGKQFIITTTGKVTDEAWKAATRSTLWTIPRVDHMRFLPQAAPGDIVIDALGRKGVNTYRPAVIATREGDINPFLHHMTMMLPSEADRNMFFFYLAHNAKYPGFKIPWAPLIQSEEGAGKGIIKRLVTHMMGGPYVYFPSAKELIDSGSKFNAWMRNKLFILVDEIRVDEKRDMVEVLKPMISEKEIEIQGKGQDQDKEDNYSNWMFFSNHKDAIPISKNGRRFAVYYSAIQSKADLEARGMNQAYFDKLYGWLDADGAAMITHWLLRFQIERGGLPMRAPETSSTAEAQRVSRGPIETEIMNAVADGLPGFRGGWVSTQALANRLKARGLTKASGNTLTRVLQSLGYFYIGRAPRSYGQETPGNPNEKTDLWYLLPEGNVDGFGALQGYG